MPRRGSILPVRRRFPPPCERIFTPTVTSTVRWDLLPTALATSGKGTPFLRFHGRPWVSETLPPITSSASADFCVTIRRRRSKQSRYTR